MESNNKDNDRMNKRKPKAKQNRLEIALKIKINEPK